tara:strand:- start:513 stop:1403 length:891 start_codon:yes stop_codon:yes gene_type:complete
MKTLKNFLEQGEPQKSEDPKVKQDIKKGNRLKKRVLQSKLRAVQGGATGIMASHEPDGELVEGVMKMIKSVARKKKEKKAAKAMDAGSRAKRKLARKVHAKYVSGSEENVPDDIREAKVDKGRSDYGKATIRNYRRKGPGHGEPAMFDPENKRGKLIDKRREEHKARRGVKGAKVPAYKVEGYQRNPEADPRSARQKRMDDPKKGINSPAFRAFMAAQQGGSKKAKKKMNEEDKAFNYVVAKLKKQYGDGVLTKRDKIKPQSAAQKAKVRAHQAKIDKENAAERAKDPSQGRYPKG